MRTILASALALGIMTTAAMAEPMNLSDDQMDGVTAGLLDNLRANLQLASVIQASAPITANTVAAVGILAEDVEAEGDTNVTSTNSSFISQFSNLGDTNN